MNARIPVWQCGCGSFEYGEFPPEECNDCNNTNSFVEVPEDRLEEMEGDLEENLIGKIRAKDYDELEDEDED